MIVYTEECNLADPREACKSGILRHHVVDHTLFPISRDHLMITIGPLLGLACVARLVSTQVIDLPTSRAHICSRALSPSCRFFLCSKRERDSGNEKRRTLRKSTQVTAQKLAKGATTFSSNSRDLAVAAKARLDK